MSGSSTFFSAVLPRACRFTLLALVTVLGMIVPVRGDEVVLDRYTRNVEAGDFLFSAAGGKMSDGLPIVPFGSLGPGEITAGDLWSFLHNRGIKSTDQLILELDIKPLEGVAPSDVDLSNITLKIGDSESSSQAGITFSLNANEGGKRIRVPAYETIAFGKEATLAVDLEFDFMSRYSADSREPVVLSVTLGGNENPSPLQFSLSSPQETGYRPFNAMLIVMFTAFWVIVFVVLYRLTNPLRPPRANPELPNERVAPRPSEIEREPVNAL